MSLNTCVKRLEKTKHYEKNKISKPKLYPENTKIHKKIHKIFIY